MKTIIGYTDQITECECCGKVDLKGTFCLEIDGVELYYGSVCAFKSHGVTVDEQKKAKSDFKRQQKEMALYELHVLPLKKEMEEKLKSGFTTDYDNLTELAKKIYHQMQAEYNRAIEYRLKKYKIQQA